MVEEVIELIKNPDPEFPESKKLALAIVGCKMYEIELAEAMKECPECKKKLNEIQKRYFPEGKLDTKGVEEAVNKL